MKTKNKSFNMVLSLVLMMIAVLCLTNVTYSYFTSSSTTGGDLVLPNLDVRFVYREKQADQFTQVDGNSITLYPTTGVIEREVSFNISLTDGGSSIYMLGIQNGSNSVSCYIRFWIDAYELDGNNPIKTVNYGKYFILNTNSAYVRASSSTSSSETSHCYYIRNAQQGNDNSAISFSNRLTLSDVSSTDMVPADLLGKKLRVSLSFEAVQSTNEAFKTVFDDERGYLKSWT